MVTSPGGTSAAALHELESGRLRTVLSEAVWAAYRRTVELGDQLEASVATSAEPRAGVDDGRRDRISRGPDERRGRGPAARAAGRPAGGRPPRADRDLWADEAALWDRLTSRWAGLDDAAWHLPGAAPSDAGGPDWSLAEHVGHVADWQELAQRLHGAAIETGALAVGRRLRRRRLRTLQRAPPRAVGLDAARRASSSASTAAATAPAGARPAPRRGHDPRARAVGLGRASPCTATTSITSRSSSRGPTSSALRQIDGDPFVGRSAAADHAGFVAQERPIARRVRPRSSGASRRRPGRRPS